MSATSPDERDLIATSAIIWAVSLPPEHFAVAAESNAAPCIRSTVRTETRSRICGTQPRRNLQPGSKGDMHERLGYCPPRDRWYRQHRSRPTAAERARHDERHESEIRPNLRTMPSAGNIQRISLER